MNRAVPRVSHLIAPSAPAVDSTLRFPTDRPADAGSPVTRVATLPPDELTGWLASHVYDLRPVFDDSPFFWHFVRFRDALSREVTYRARGVRMDIEDIIGERVLFTLLGFSIVFAAAWLLVPFVAIHRQWRAIPHKARPVATSPPSGWASCSSR